MKSAALVLLVIFSILWLISCTSQLTEPSVDLFKDKPIITKESAPVKENVISQTESNEEQNDLLHRERLGTLCSNMEECLEFCPKNQEKCTAYCEEHMQDNKICQELAKQNKGGCSTYEECKVYCIENPDDIACVHFFEEKDSFEMPLLRLPINLDDKITSEWGLWPFCVHGGEHPEGHGGIDFELKPGAKVYATADGVVEEIFSPSDDPSGHGAYSLFIQHGLGVSGYSGLTNIQVKKGDKVKKGEYIADAFKLGNEYFLHFEVNNFIDQILVCPVQFFDETAQAELQKMLEESTYPEKNVEGKLCNCDWLPYKENMKRQEP